MSDLDLALEQTRDLIVRATTRKVRPTKDIRLHEDTAAAKGLPPYGYVPIWHSEWGSFQLYRVAITGKGKLDKCVVYYGHFDRALIKPPKNSSQVLFSREKSKVPDGYPEWCDGATHTFGRIEILFTPQQILDWYHATARAHRVTLGYESDRLVALMADLGSQAQSITARMRELNNPFPYKVLHGIHEPKRKRTRVVY